MNANYKSAHDARRHINAYLAAIERGEDVAEYVALIREAVLWIIDASRSEVA
jgi:hypothetical protein